MIKTFRPTYENSVITLRDKNDKVKGYLIEWDGKNIFYEGSDKLIIRNKKNATLFKFYKDADMSLKQSEENERKNRI